MGAGAAEGSDFIDGKSAATADALLNRNNETATLKDFMAHLDLVNNFVEITIRNELYQSIKSGVLTYLAECGLLVTQRKIQPSLTGLLAISIQLNIFRRKGECQSSFLVFCDYWLSNEWIKMPV
jgi:hypothetical protein